MMYTGTDIQLRKGTKTVEYSYDGETWKSCTVTGMDSSATISSLVTMGEGESTVWVIVYKSSSGARACSSTNGIDWIPIYYDASNITLSKGSTYLYLNCNDGRQYRTTDGITWQMTSTKRY